MSSVSLHLVEIDSSELGARGRSDRVLINLAALSKDNEEVPESQEK